MVESFTKKKPTEYVYPSIKKQIKSKYDIDLVLISGGIGFSAFKEDVELMTKVEMPHTI